MKLPVNYNDVSIYDRRRVRTAYINKQDGKCYHCKERLSRKPSEDILKKKINTKLFPDGFFNWPVHLHHDHNTGMTIGAVHSVCNAVIWQYHGE